VLNLAYINRFLSADTIVPNSANPQSFNRYSHFENRPLQFVDPEGLMGWGAAVGGAVGAMDGGAVGGACGALGGAMGGDKSVITSFDPNDILGPSGYGDDNHIVPDRIFGYTIRFENDPDETTAPAFVVVITQVLDLDLDYDTFELGEFGFGPWRWDIPAGRSYCQTRLGLRPERNILVDVTASLDLEIGLARWQFFTLDPETLDLPMSDPEVGFLPPNATAPEGEGFVSYRIRPHQGTRIDAEASIVFDVNEPVLTPAIYHTIDAGPPTSAINPLPPVMTTTTFTGAGRVKTTRAAPASVLTLSTWLRTMGRLQRY
jgi:hypothetical protein